MEDVTADTEAMGGDVCANLRAKQIRDIPAHTETTKTLKQLHATFIVCVCVCVCVVLSLWTEAAVFHRRAFVM